ncbi:MAG: flagellar biosynthesis protein FlhF [Sulfurospirillum cavolei]|uniref:Flagellar biosynthesis protein FlhF n=1 Tax=Sulfurospirillum cavolei TaxID=366522 RepID=A0A2D3WG67_9BACT|nr:flagellar biosynthesis protein FlhF [Sulfurospirillum cavolei]MDY0263585.1 flagellar biosynthesis protein FlhF [Sulfurospirillum cavolei]DAB36704.1 MAG TPA: flagellar biosynthesis protein FlhF [Sulfurospirillum cavolei]
MKFHTFSGETPAEALKLAQRECGENALVISTKQLRKKTISTSALYEVVVAVDEEQLPVQKSEPKIESKYKSGEDVLLSLSEAAKQISQIAQATGDTGSFGSSSKAVDKAQNIESIGEIKSEITKLADKIKLIQEMFWEEKAHHRNHLAIPSEFAEIYKLAKTSGMGEDHLENIMNLTLEHMPSRMKNSSETIKRYFQVLLRKLIPVRMETELPKGSKRIMMFVGPTGVGKTTTIAKLAARYSYIQEKRAKVGIITLDTYRIGAVEQLFQYAKMMRLPIEDVVEPNDFNQALSSLSHCDVILIDTVGSSQYDKEKLLKLNTFLQKSDLQIDVNLVLSAGSKLEDLKEIYHNFSFLTIDTLIFTKFDETKVFGTIFSLIYDIDKPVSYFSIGQEVPDDIVPASSDFLVECILDGFEKKRGEHANASK